MPPVFTDLGAVDAHADHLHAWTDAIHRRVTGEPGNRHWLRAAVEFTRSHNFVPFYFTTRNLKEICSRRADLIEAAVRSTGQQVDYTFPLRPPGRAKLRLGVLAAHFGPQTERFHTLPAYQHLDRDRFEVILYALFADDGAMERYCRDRVDRFVPLPAGDLARQAAAIRSADLDVLLIGTNVTAVANGVALLAVHRLARAQATLFSSPVTTGIRNMDYFISGTLSESARGPEHYRERLLTMDGPGFCFDYTQAQAAGPTLHRTRPQLGLPDNAVVFVSGANLFKIVPELMSVWARILAAVPRSVLLLYPLGPAWTNAYPVEAFLAMAGSMLARSGVDPARLLVLKQLAGRTDVMQCLRLCDVYLDSLRHAGGHSLADPLEVGLPSVSVEGEFLRARHGAAMLRDANLHELVAADEEAYVQLAIRLGTDSEIRAARRAAVVDAMCRQPSYRNPQAYSRSFGELLSAIVHRDLPGRPLRRYAPQEFGA